MTNNAYRELGTVNPDWLDPVALDLEKIQESFNKDDSERVQRVLNCMMKQYKNNREVASWEVVDPGKHWWNMRKHVLPCELHTPFGRLLVKRAASLGIEFHPTQVWFELPGRWKDVLGWSFKTPT